MLRAQLFSDDEPAPGFATAPLGFLAGVEQMDVGGVSLSQGPPRKLFDGDDFGDDLSLLRAAGQQHNLGDELPRGLWGAPAAGQVPCDGEDTAWLRPEDFRKSSSQPISSTALPAKDQAEGGEVHPAPPSNARHENQDGKLSTPCKSKKRRSGASLPGPWDVLQMPRLLMAPPEEAACMANLAPTKCHLTTSSLKRGKWHELRCALGWVSADEA